VVQLSSGSQTPRNCQALHFVAEKMGQEVDKVTIPSQRRYLQVLLS
jgi:hypothetical protein